MTAHKPQCMRNVFMGDALRHFSLAGCQQVAESLESFSDVGRGKGTQFLLYFCQTIVDLLFGNTFQLVPNCLQFPAKKVYFL